MKNTNDTTTESGIESALAMYRETVSPSRSMLSNILTQIPEKNVEKKIANNIKIPYNVRAIRSPYIWLAFTQTVTVAVILLALMPTLSERYIYRNDPFYAIDKQVDIYERTLNEEDTEMPLVDYTNNSL